MCTGNIMSAIINQRRNEALDCKTYMCFKSKKKIIKKLAERLSKEAECCPYVFGIRDCPFDKCKPKPDIKCWIAWAEDNGT